MDLRQLAKWAVEKGLVFEDGNDKGEDALDILERIATIGPAKARRWAAVWKMVPVFDWVVRNLMKRLRTVSAKPHQVGVITFGSEPLHPASLGSTLNYSRYIGEAVREGHLVFDLGTHAEIYAA